MIINPERSQGYDPQVTCLKFTEDPLNVIQLACNITMFTSLPQSPVLNEFCPSISPCKDSGAFIHNLVQMNHTSLFEHVHYTFLLRQISRSCLAQITRHRIGSFTSGSQHYQNYQGYDFRIESKWAKNPFVLEIFETSLQNYDRLRRLGCPKEEARQILPNGMCVNLLWTVNARSLINFLRLRLCHRNVQEIRVLAERVHAIVTEKFPELFSIIGLDCFEKKCSQGKMKCKTKVTP